MIDLILIILTLITLTVSSITDFKRREVPDWISHGFVAGALGIRLLFSILNNDYSLFTTGVLGAGIFFGISYVAYYLGQWGGGDVKIAAGMGAVLGFSQLSFLFVILLLFAGAIYGIFYSMTLAIIHRKEFSRTFKRLYVQHRKYVVAMLVFLILSVVYYVTTQSTNAFLVCGIASLSFIGSISFLFVKAVEDSCMYKKIKAHQLTEGDWIADEVVLKKLHISSAKNKGITLHQIKLLKNYKKQITIKLGIPFIPGFWLAYVFFILVNHYVL